MTKQQYVCGAVYSPFANAIADCQICGWEISRHKTADSTGKGPFGLDAGLISNREPDAWMSSINPKLVTPYKAEAECWHQPGIPLYRAFHDWPREIEALLDGLGDRAIRVREGNGVENLIASLAVTLSRHLAYSGSRPQTGDAAVLQGSGVAECNIPKTSEQP